MQGTAAFRKGAALVRCSVPVPPLIYRETFGAVQSRLRANNPKVRSLRFFSGPNLLTDIC